ncbi:MAG: hypothetical protein LUD17_05555 [Bacteroidales bacterium]|nr:hypothetical protein [Bacteroidales bacterium]
MISSREKNIRCSFSPTVEYLEVQRMIDALKAEGKDFEYEIYPWMPGAHAFERIDNKESSEIRLKTYRFLECYLQPRTPLPPSMICAKPDINTINHKPSPL